MHVPVLLQEVLSVLKPEPGEFFVDGTLGAGGHARAIIAKLEPGGSFLGVDRDINAIHACQAEFASERIGGKLANLVIEQANYGGLPELLKKHGLPKVNGLLLDLGVSSDQLAHGPAGAPSPAGDLFRGASRGFSFLTDEPLLMTYDDEAIPVKELLTTLTEAELAKIILDFSDERYGRQIARSIKEALIHGPIETTKQLTEVILKAVPTSYEHGRIHPATRTFMALRMYANKELYHLEELLKSFSNFIAPGGRVAIVSFHSIEDRLVKHYFRKYAATGVLNLINKKPITASLEELNRNPRARSAKLRAAMMTTTSKL